MPLVYFGGKVMVMRRGLCVNLVQYSISSIMEVVEVLLRTLHELMKDRPCHMKRTLDDDFQGSFFFCFTPQRLYNAQHHLAFG